MLVIAGSLVAVKEKKNLIQHIPEPFISLDRINGIEYIIVVEKFTQQLFLYAFDGRYKKIYSFKCSTGKNIGAKTRSGDSKTPEGIYFFTKKHIKKYLSPIYGSKAFPINYPNLFDQHMNLGGNSIWLHGTNKPIKMRASNGCVVLENTNINTLGAFISLFRTPIIIVNKLFFVPAAHNKKIKKKIINSFLKWKNALVNGTYQEYSNFYDESFKLDNKLWLELNTLLTTFFNSHRSFSIEMGKTIILKHKKYYVALFDHNVNFLGTTYFIGTKKIFFNFQNENIKILVEKYLRIPNENTKYLVASLTTLKKQYEDKEDKEKIKSLINTWTKVWSLKDLSKYGACYANRFQHGDMDLKSWLKYKHRLNEQYKVINVTIDNLKINVGQKKSIAGFIQRYKSDKYNDLCKKQLILIRENGKWKIYREFSIAK